MRSRRPSPGTGTGSRSTTVGRSSCGNREFVHVEAEEGGLVRHTDHGRLLPYGGSARSAGRVTHVICGSGRPFHTHSTPRLGGGGSSRCGRAVLALRPRVAASSVRRSSGEGTRAVPERSERRRDGDRRVSPTRVHASQGSSSMRSATANGSTAHPSGSLATSPADGQLTHGHMTSSFLMDGTGWGGGGPT